MPSNLSTTVDKVMNLANQKNSKLILKFHDIMKENGASERHQNNNLKQYWLTRSLSILDF